MITYAVDGTAEVALIGEFDSANAAGIIDAVQEAIRSGARGVALDMSAVTFLDSSALSAMFEASRACSAANIPLALMDPSHPVARILALTGLSAVFEQRRPRTPGEV